MMKYLSFTAAAILAATAATGLVSAATPTAADTTTAPLIRVVHPTTVILKHSDEHGTKAPLPTEATAAPPPTRDAALGSISLDTLREAKKYIFRDVPGNYWAARSIATMTQQNLISGYSDGTFRPDKPLTREEAASLFSKLINEPSTVMLSSSFSDITSDRWSALAIEAVARKNIISGYGDNTYRPEQFMSRQEFAVVADNYLHYLGYVTEDPTVLDGIAFSDQKFVASWAQDAVRELASLGFLHYNPRNLFNPEKYITRAEATEITYRMTQGKEAAAFKDALQRQKTDRALDALVVRTLGKNYDMRNNAVKYWRQDTLWVSFANGDDAKAIGAAMAFAADKSDLRRIRITTGPLTQAAIDDIQTDAAYAYHQALADGTVLDVYPDKAVKHLVIVVDRLPDTVKKELSKQFPTVRFTLADATATESSD